MSIFRTVRKIKDCDDCHGSGRVEVNPGTGDGAEQPCVTCNGTGRVEVSVRANRTSVQQAEAATKQMNPGPARKAAKARLADPEPSKTGFIEEE
jgi:DnaJ-class molecular chaperone